MELQKLPKRNLMEFIMETGLKFLTLRLVQQVLM